MIIHIIIVRIPIFFPRIFNFFWRGVSSFFELFRKEAILPIFVFIPVETTIPSPRPYVTIVDIYPIFFLSAIGIDSLFEIILVFFSVGRDSPVRADSSTLRFTHSKNLISAGIILPASSIIMSPTTKSFELISIILLSRLTIAFGDDRFFNASRDFSALFSWMIPIVAFKIITMNIIILSSGSPRKNDIIPVSIKM
ncbi:hypothetical protein MOUSESFB_0347 [Candidatus Arthromitus sp. SFB-mouse-Yit]|nr:hypothetical protein MOUSESFB_0347 [Candidatus Arthromitus sp. SFB-mouse-Yit]